MAYVELIAGGFLGVLTATINAEGTANRLFIKAPIPIFGALLLADALARLGYLTSH